MALPDAIKEMTASEQARWPGRLADLQSGARRASLGDGMDEPSFGKDLEQYIVELVGSSLRHSFRTPLSIISNAAREVEGELEATPLVSREATAEALNLCAAIHSNRLAALEQYQALGLTFKGGEEIIDLQKARQLLGKVVEPLLQNVRTAAQKLKGLTQNSSNEVVVEFAKLADVQAGRMLRIYEGMVKIIGVPEDIKLRETVAIHGRLGVTGEQIRRNFNLQKDRGEVVDILARGGSTIEGSKALIDIMFLNILENAVRYALRAPLFFVKVSVRETNFEELHERYPFIADVGNGRWAELHFLNTGPPIPPEKVEEIFRLYVTTEQPSEGPTGGGSGIGLALSRLIAALHGGYIFVDVANTSATDFAILLPLEAPTSEQLRGPLHRAIRR